MGCAVSKGDDSQGPKLNFKDDSFVTRGLKVVLLGDSGVGKSSICQRYINDTINDTYDVTLGASYFLKEVTLENGREVRLHIWDTGGEERYRAIASLYYKDAKAALLVFDVNDAKSFKSLEYWVKELSEKVREQNMVLIIVGNKDDLDSKKVSEEQVKLYAAQIGLKYIFVSAKTGSNINKLFETLTHELTQKEEENEQSPQ